MDGEFTGGSFQELLARLNLKDSQSTSKNPQLNALCKQIHQMVADILWTLLHNNPPKDLSQAKDVIDDALATTMHVMRPQSQLQFVALLELKLSAELCS